MRALITGLVLMGLAQVAIADDKELKQSMANTKTCKMIIIKAAMKDHPNAKKNAETQHKKTLAAVDKFCGNTVKWFEGCKVVTSGSDKCLFVEVDKKTREEGRGRKYFPKDFQ